MKITKFLTLISALLVLSATTNAEDLKTKFKNPTDHNETSMYWYWINGNMSEYGIKKDLDAMKAGGINRAYIGFIGLEDGPAIGNCKYMSDEWWGVMHTALKYASEIGVNIGIFNGQGWSQSGGPWIPVERSMRYLNNYEYEIKGGKNIKWKLPETDKDFQHLGLLAYPKSKNYKKVSELPQSVTSSYPIEGIDKLVDNDTTTHVIIPKNGDVNIKFNKPTKVSSISVVAAMTHNIANCELWYKNMKSENFEKVKDFRIDRYFYDVKVGFDPDAPTVISFKDVVSNEYKIVIKDIQQPLRLSNIFFHQTPIIEAYPEKSMAKMYQSYLPAWNEYQWDLQPEISNDDALDPSKIVDLSNSIKDGYLETSLPKGDWIILHYGMMPTKVTNDPSFADARGLEVDKMNKQHVEFHFDKFIGEILRRIPAQDRTSFKYLISDSYETGGQNFTDDMFEAFKERYGYDPIQFLPVFSGIIVKDAISSDRFLWDVRRLVADRIAYDYVGGLRDVSHKHGLTLWLENYGHWGFPAEFLQYGGQTDEIGGEFWSTGPEVTMETRAAISAAHIYGKTKIFSESFTSGYDKPFSRHPADLKSRADFIFSQGINSSVLHINITQPDDKAPGINAWFGNEFNRHNTWFSYIDIFTEYLKRVGMMLQQGTNIADVAYYVGEDAPKMTGIIEPALPKGYEYDYMNSEVIVRDMEVKDGYLTLPHGTKYKILVLPPQKTMRPEVLKKLYKLVKDGAIILGEQPLSSPSNENQPTADNDIKTIGAEMWGEALNKKGKKTLGKGRIYVKYSLEEIFADIDLSPDFETNGENILYSHRESEDKDIYFVTNHKDSLQYLTMKFRSTKKHLERWNPVTGEREHLIPTTDHNGSTISLVLEPNESIFFVLDNNKPADTSNPKEFQNMEISNNWSVKFSKNLHLDQEKDIFMENLTLWNNSSDEDIKYYSGTASYTKTVDIKAETLAVAKNITLDIEKVDVMAKVYINDKYIGGLWTLPYRLDISNALLAGENKIRIDVVNTWANRLIGDSRLPIEERRSFATVNSWRPEDTLDESGLSGAINIIFKK